MGHLCPTKVTCAGCGIRLSDGYTDGTPACKTCTGRQSGRLKRGTLFSPTGYAGEAIDNTTGRIVAHTW